jgi:L-lactate dehydrogenase (cytochrome)
VLTEAAVRKAEKRGCKALFITVDAPQLGRREKDLRNKATGASNAQKGMSVDTSKGVAAALSSFIDPALCWEDLKWFRSITTMPLILKGVQCVEDAVQAHHYGCDGIVLSNHGGRQLDFAPSGIEILPEVMHALKMYNSKMEVYVDGGIRRGTDIFKALALGAKAVGIGRPVLYGLASYGQAGVERVLQMLKDELIVCMRLMGTPKLSDITERHVCIKNLADHFAVQAPDFLSRSTYEPLITGLAHARL